MNEMPTFPLHGIRVVLTRPQAQSEALARQLRELGARVGLLPCIEIAAIDANDARLRQIVRKAPFDWIFFTSRNAVQIFRDKLCQHGLELPTNIRIAAIGSATARVAAALGFTVHFTARAKSATAFAEQFVQTQPQAKHVLYPASVLAQSQMESVLSAKGITVTRIDLYTTRPAVTASQARNVLCNHPDFIVFFSPSAVEAFWGAISQNPKPAIGAARCVAIGETTAAALQRHGLAQPLVAETPSGAAVINCLLQQVQLLQTGESSISL